MKLPPTPTHHTVHFEWRFLFDEEWSDIEAVTLRDVVDNAQETFEELCESGDRDWGWQHIEVGCFSFDTGELLFVSRLCLHAEDVADVSENRTHGGVY